ncbi:amidohydrolase family protein [Derxia lacustris]|uniref:amidohydrolase family protein n=1 Tax=Derxia lacustris TaxID=764842 RepID=UPI001F36EFFD|nr:amidohydrolase family protein [Derxia lacustris]
MSAARKIIDLRSRPSFLHEFYGSTPGTAGYDTARWLNRRVGSHDDRHFERGWTLDGFVAEIRAAGIAAATVIGRDTPTVATSNDAVAALIAGQPELIGIGSVDPQRLGEAELVAEIERAAALGLRGINLEPGFGALPLHFDDALLEPVYETCARLGLPVFLMTGPTTPDFRFNDPAPIGRVARRHPDLQLVVSHGSWPYVNEIVGIAFRYANVNVVPDMYLFLPGSGLYVEAANGFLREQFLFATSFPFRAMKQTVDDFLALGWRDEVLDAVLHGNAERVLGLA